MAERHEVERVAVLARAEGAGRRTRGARRGSRRAARGTRSTRAGATLPESRGDGDAGAGPRRATPVCPHETQIGLFGGAAAPPLPDAEADARLAARLPTWIRPGPSTWTFPGWAGIVYPPGIGKEELLDHGLGLAARHPLFRTVGIDRSYYAPLDEAELRRYAAQLPQGFRCVIKAWSAITTLADPRTLAPNPRFLDVDVLEKAVLLPLARAFHDHAGPVVLQLAPIPPPALPRPEAFADTMDRFLGALPTAFAYAVELRNRELLTPAYLAVLGRHRVAHVISLWERMPTVGRQLEIPGVLGAPFAVCRLSLTPGHRYDERRASFAPFDRIVAPDPVMRADVAALARACAAQGKKPLYVIVNNKVEGSSPLTVRALVERMAEALSGLHPPWPLQSFCPLQALLAGLAAALALAVVQTLAAVPALLPRTRAAGPAGVLGHGRRGSRRGRAGAAHPAGGGQDPAGGGERQRPDSSRDHGAREDERAPRSRGIAEPFAARAKR